jgi:hypothetical protein
MQRTLRPAVTQVVKVDTHRGALTAVEAWTHDVLTVPLIFVAQTVVEAIAASVDRETIRRFTGTTEVCLWTWRVLTVLTANIPTHTVQIYQAWRTCLYQFISRSRTTVKFIRVVKTVGHFIATL